MATNNQFKTYKAESKYKRKPLSSSGIRSYSELVEQAKKNKQKKANELASLEEMAIVRQNVAAYEHNKALQEKNEIEQNRIETEKENAGTLKRVGDTAQDIGGKLAKGTPQVIANVNTFTEKASLGINKLWENIKGGLAGLLGDKRQAELIKNRNQFPDLYANHSNSILTSNQPGSPQYIADSIEKWSNDAELSYVKDASPNAQNIIYGVTEAVGEMLPSIFMGQLGGGAASLTTMGLSAAGASTQQALNEGGSIEESLAYGVLSGAKEVLTEKLIGGGLGKLTKAGGWLDNAIAKISTNKAVRIGIDILGEGAEEAIAEMIDPLLKNLTYSSGEEVDWGNVLESGIIGIITGSIFEGANIVVEKGQNANINEVLEEYNKVTKMEQAETEQGNISEENKAKYRETKENLVALLERKIGSMNTQEQLKLLGNENIGQHELLKNYNPMGIGSKIGSNMATPNSLSNETQKTIISENNGQELESVAKKETVETKIEEIEQPKQQTVDTPLKAKEETTKIVTPKEETQPKVEVKESKHLETVKEAGKEYFDPELNDMLEMEKLTYQVVGNQETLDKAKSELKGKQTSTQIESLILKLKDNKDLNEVDVAKADLLIQDANKKGQYQEAIDLAGTLSDRLTKMGRFIQAASIIQRLSPEGRLMSLNRKATKINEKGVKNKTAFKKIVDERIEKYFKADEKIVKKQVLDAFIENNPDITLSKEQMTRLTNLTVNSQGYQNNVAKVFQEVIQDTNKANQLADTLAKETISKVEELDKQYHENTVIIPLSLTKNLMEAKSQANIDEASKNLEKAVLGQETADLFERMMQWRYLAMLFNPKTHVRNKLSNIIMGKVVDFTNVVERAIQTTFIKDTSKRTKTFVKTSPKMQNYSDSVAIETLKKIEDNSKFEEANKDKRIFANKLLESVRKFNFLMLEKADISSMKNRFSKEFGEWATAKGYTVEQIQNDSKLLEEGSLYALEQAQKATFRDACKFSMKLNLIKMNSRFAEFALGTVMPFTKTPINIARRGLDYSPVGLVRSIYSYAKNVKNRKMTADQFAHQLSQGLSGTGIMFLGMLLSSMGILGGGDDEDRKAANYEKSIGEQPFSIRIGDKTYTLDWLAPFSIPLFTGVEIYESLKKSDNEDKWAVIGSFTASLDPLTEMSFLQGINRALSSYSDNKIGGFVDQAVQSFIGQFFPTLGSQIAKTIDDTRRTTTSTKKGVYTKQIEQYINYLKSKIPFLAETLQPYVNVWGEIEEETNFENRLLENSVYPYWISNNKMSDVDKEIMRLYTEYGNSEVLPGIPNSYYTVDGERIDMTEEEYTDFKIKVGTFSKTQLNEIFLSKIYQNMSDENKEKSIKKVYDMAREYAKGGNEYLSYVALGNKKEQLGKYVVELSSIEGDKDENGDTIYNSKKNKVLVYIEAQKLTKVQKHLLYALAGYKNTADKEEVITYINSLDSLTKEQKTKLLELFNY